MIISCLGRCKCGQEVFRCILMGAEMSKETDFKAQNVSIEFHI